MEDNSRHESGKKFGGKFHKPLSYLLMGLVAAIASVALYAGAQYLYQKRAAKQASQGVLDNPATAQLGPEGGLLKRTSESFRLVAKKVGPAVVNITSTKSARPTLRGSGRPGRRGGRPMPQQPPPDDEGFPRDPFQEFFERFGSPFPQQESPQTSLGSGVIIDKAGHVVTNNHVVEDATEILVRLNGAKTDIKAKVIGTDPKTDLAVLKMESTKDLPTPAEWADSNSTEVGDWAIAIGSPFALGQSVTVGIISAKGGRNSLALGNAEYGNDLIQTDAAINPGNSGGPLCDVDGKVMGINTAIYTRSGGYMGIGFAIPSNLAKDVVGKLITDGKIVYGWLGVYIQSLDPELAKELGVKDGVGIHEVIEDSPAAKAGLRAGDVVVEVQGVAIKEVNELQKTISGFKPGETIKMKVVSYADKKTRTVSVKIGELPSAEPQAKASPNDEPDKLGVVVAGGKGGVTIEAVAPGSVADQVGLEVGDVIVSVNRRDIGSIADYRKAMSSSKRIYLEVKRRGRKLFYQFVLPE